MNAVLIPVLIVLVLICAVAAGHFYRTRTRLALAPAEPVQPVTPARWLEPLPPAEEPPTPEPEPVTLESDATPLTYRALTVEFMPEADTPVVAVKPKRDYAVLKQELYTDPTNLGYAPLITKQDYEGIAKLLNTVPMIPNPEPRGTQPRRLRLHSLVKKMTLTEALDFYKVGKLVEHIEQTLEPKDRAKLIDLVNICDPFLSDATEAKLDTLLNETIPDEDWPATVPGQSRATVIGWPFVLPADVQQVVG